MSRKNLKLLLVLMVIILGVVLSFFYLGNKPGDTIPDDTGGGDNFFSDLLNFVTPDNSDDEVKSPTDVSGYIPDGAEMPILKLVKISSMPVAGYLVFDQERFVDVAPPVKTEGSSDETPEVRPTAPQTESRPVLRYMAKENGNIYQTFVDKISERKFSDNIIPGVHEAFFGENGESVVARYLKSNNIVTTWSGKLPKEVLGSDSSSSSKLEGTFLVDNITDLSISPKGDQIFYLFNSGNNAIGIASSPEGDKKAQIYNGPYTEWLSSWTNDGVVALTTKPSSLAPGFMYIIDSSKKDFNKVLGNVLGLTTLISPDGNNVLYSNNKLNLSLYKVDERDIRNLSIKTITDKCTWEGNVYVYCAVPKFVNSSYLYPDSWYQGEVAFSDDIWRINVEDGTSKLILNTFDLKIGEASVVEPIDAIKLSTSKDGKYLFFINKNDSFLWGLKVD